MNDKKLERATKVINALLFVAAAIMFMLTIMIQVKHSKPTSGNIEIFADVESQNTSVSPQNALESKNGIFEDTDEVVEIAALRAVVEVESEVEKNDVEAVFEMETPVETVQSAVEEASEVPTVDHEELELLAKVIYQEAGSDSCCDECRRRVADVVLNRVADERFPNTMLGVLTQERQYGRYHWTGVVWPDRASYDSEKAAVERAYRIAEEVLSGEGHSDLYGQGYIWQAEFIQGTGTVVCENCWIYFGR